MQSIIKEIAGFIIYFVIFIVAVPTGLASKGYYNFLIVYLPNVDLIANLLTQVKGPSNIWETLYMKDKTVIEMSTTTLINFIALVGLVYLVARETKRKNNLCAGLALGSAMAFITYLLPAPIVDYFIKEAHKKIKHLYPKSLEVSIIFILGSIMTLGFIFAEMFILKKYRKTLIKLACKLSSSLEK